ncbi:glutaminyl-peptide cyclotransferase [Pedobacter sp. HMF7647]|uniref:Glutaminyl-peptide cyclotransferase n=1 Tax=Hufsiella arboris TaxID=2695275 RepID=A0A7K1Y4B0_9SPHI|nr:glutaminyl-peptide cyclotransferase [Hufsiella arboris]MXV49413.1 glutaminyl-peptide cyclotransferase [Hufsiella arboris]
MNRKFIIPLAALFSLAACKTNKNLSVSFVSPEAGSVIKADTTFKAELDLAGKKPDSVVYFMDLAKVGKTSGETASADLKTTDLKLGNHLLTAKVFADGTTEEAGSNIVVVASKAPVEYSFKVVNIFPHDTASFTEGLEYHDGFLYESTGEYGESTLQKVDLTTGKAIKKIDLDSKYFGEGITIIGDKIIQLTYQEHVGFVYDKNTFKKLSEFNYQAGAEGWGMYFDGDQILTNGGSNEIHILNKDSYQKVGDLDVYDDKGPVNQLNEMEMIDGKIYANIWQTNRIVIIDPKTGAVEGNIDLSDLYPLEKRNINADVLNGIAYDKVGKRLFVTGKKWDKLFEIKVTPKEATAAK